VTSNAQTGPRASPSFPDRLNATDLMPHTQLSASAWWAQSERDADAADLLLQGGLEAHAVAMAHLSVEKALKAVYRSQQKGAPPVTHNLTVLAERVALALPPELAAALDDLSGLDVSLLYQPEALFRRRLPTSMPDARKLVADAKALREWIRKEARSDTADA